MSKPPAGGAATVNGVLYQMLWSLLRAVTLYTSECDHDAQSGAVDRAVLILEPLPGGGDLQQLQGPRRTVVQLKSTAEDDTWSLRKVVQDVLPDLYVAYDPAIPETEYRFVTEGRMGQWKDVYRFFQGLKARPDPGPGEDVLAKLNNARVLKFHPGSTRVPAPDADPPFWGDGPHTERSIFEKIVQEVRKRQLVRDRETVEATRVGVWRLLANFTLVPGQTMDSVRREIDALLLALVDSDVTVNEKRQAMLAGLAEQATQGGAHVRADEFLAQYHLNSIPLTNWARLRVNAAQYLAGVLDRSGYQMSDDVRTERASATLRDWSADRPLLAIVGASGAGKSWLLSGLAVAASTGAEIAILIEATGDGDMDCQRAADVFWRYVKGNDHSLSLDRIAARRHELVHERSDRWLMLLIDNVQSMRELRQLIQLPWETWKIRVALACTPEAARTFRGLAGTRGQVCEVGDFTVPELRTYLTRHLGEGWGGIPADVLRTLRRPLLARIYCDLAGPGGWQPTNEYELYRRYWLRLFEAEQGEHPLDAVPLQRLAFAVANGARYPWTGDQLHQAGLGNDALLRLSRVGWLQAIGPDRYQVWHDRLLNWAVAEALVAQFDGGQLDIDGLCACLRRLFQTAGGGARKLGYVPMDALWMLTDPARSSAVGVADRVIEALERPS